MELLVKSINANNVNTIILAKLSEAEFLEAYKIKVSMKEVNREKVLFTTLKRFVLYPPLVIRQQSYSTISSFPGPPSPRIQYISDLWNFNATGHCVDQKCK